MSVTEIARLRDEIADVDKEIVNLVAKRFQLAAQVGLEKKLLGLPLQDEGTEELVRTRFREECATRGISASFSGGLARLLIGESLRRQKQVRGPQSRGGGAT